MPVLGSDTVTVIYNDLVAISISIGSVGSNYAAGAHSIYGVADLSLNVHSLMGIDSPFISAPISKIPAALIPLVLLIDLPILHRRVRQQLLRAGDRVSPQLGFVNFRQFVSFAGHRIDQRELRRSSCRIDMIA